MPRGQTCCVWHMGAKGARMGTGPQERTDLSRRASCPSVTRHLHNGAPTVLQGVGRDPHDHMVWSHRGKKWDRVNFQLVHKKSQTLHALTAQSSEGRRASGQ